MAETLSFAELISKVAHELRSPLTSIKGFSATLVKRWDRFDDDSRRQFVETIHNDAERMNRIVTEVLDLARLEAGRIEYRFTEQDVDALIKEAIANLEGRPGIERIEVEGSSGSTVVIDGERVGRVLENIIENALKFSEDGPVKVGSHEGDDHVTISVADAGVGIAPDRLAEVFEGPGPHGQLATPTGSGLGLYLAKRLIEGQGGSLTVTSEQGSGSTFVVTLPTAGPPRE